MTFGKRFHEIEVVRSVHDERYIVRIGRTGVEPWALGFNQYKVPISWLIYLFRKEKTWTVQVTPRYGTRRTLLDEQYPTRELAAERAEAVANAIVAGEEPWADR